MQFGQFKSTEPVNPTYQRIAELGLEKLNLTTYMCNKRMKPQEDFRPNITPEVIDRNPPEFARLVGLDDWMGWSDPIGPRDDRVRKFGDPNSPLAKRLRDREAQMSA